MKQHELNAERCSDPNNSVLQHQGEHSCFEDAHWDLIRISWPWAPNSPRELLERDKLMSGRQVLLQITCPKIVWGSFNQFHRVSLPQISHLNIYWIYADWNGPLHLYKCTTRLQDTLNESSHSWPVPNTTCGCRCWFQLNLVVTIFRRHFSTRINMWVHESNLYLYIIDYNCMWIICTKLLCIYIYENAKLYYGT